MAIGLPQEDPLSGSDDPRKQLVARFIDDVTNHGNLGAIGEYLAADYVEHYGPPGLPSGVAGAAALTSAFVDAFDGYRFDLEEILADGDRVVARGWGHGRHTGPFMGIAPTGREIRFRAAHVFEVRDGRIAARWAYPDMLGLLQQLGAITAPG